MLSLTHQLPLAALALQAAFATAVLGAPHQKRDSTPQHVPITTSLQTLGRTSDPNFAQNFSSDGGAGGHVGKYNLITLSDPRIGDNGIPSAHVAYAYFPASGSTKPTDIEIIGNYSNSPPSFYSGTGGGVINADAGDGDCQGVCFAPGPNSAVVDAGDGVTGIGVWPVYPNEKSVAYNTMFELKVTDPDDLNNQGSPIPVTRVVDKLFDYTAGEPGYGSEALATGVNGDATLYLFAGDTTGLKLARAPLGSHADRSTYSYWNNATGAWQDSPLAYNDDADGDIVAIDNFSPFGVDVWFSDYHATWLVATSNGNIPSDAMSVVYSTTGDITGPYSDPVQLFAPALDDGCIGSQLPVTYYPHAHPGFYGTDSNQLLVSWESCNTYTNMGTVTFG